MKAIKFHPFEDADIAASRLAPLRSRTGVLWLMSSMVSLGIGVWLLVAAPLLGATRPSATSWSELLSGALTILITLLSLGKRTRAFRMAEIAVGGWLLITPWFISGGTWPSQWNASLCGLALIVLPAFLGKKPGL